MTSAIDPKTVPQSEANATPADNTVTGGVLPKLIKDNETRLLRRFMMDWVWPRRRMVALAIGYSTLLAVASATYPYVIKTSVDGLINGKVEILGVVIAAILASTLARSVFLYLQTLTTNGVVLDLTNDIQKRAFGHLMSADFATLSREAPGQLVSKLTNDVAYIGLASQAALNTAIRDTLLVFGQVCAMLYSDWRLTLVVLSVYPLAAWPIASISKRLRNVAKTTQAGLGDITALLSEQLAGARLIKTYGLEDLTTARVSKTFDELQRLRFKAVKNRARIDPTLEALGGIAIAGVLSLVYFRIGSDVATPGSISAFFVSLFMASQPIRSLGNLSARIREGLAAVERLYVVLDEKPKVVDRPGAHALKITGCAIKFDGVGFAYDNSQDVPVAPSLDDADQPAKPRALSNFTLDIAGRTTVAFVGRSGAGKTTVINLVPRLFDVTSGAILIDGQDIREVEVKSLRAAISIVSQDVTLFDDTIAANIALGRLGATQGEIEHAARDAAAHDFIMARPDGYATRIGDRGYQLSGGQRQRLALARAILKDAPILLLDEATSALDSESERLVQAALARFTKTRTTLVIAHRLSTVQSADLICVLDEGRLIETGTHAQLMAKGGAYARLSQSQTLGLV